MKCLIISFLVSLLFSFIFIIFKYNFGQLYNLSDIAYDYYKIGLNFYACGFLFVSISRVICSYFYSVENKKYANIITMIEPLILTPVAYFSICSVLKLNGLWLSYLIIQIKPREEATHELRNQKHPQHLPAGPWQQRQVQPC